MKYEVGDKFFSLTNVYRHRHINGIYTIIRIGLHGHCVWYINDQGIETNTSNFNTIKLLIKDPSENIKIIEDAIKSLTNGERYV